MTAVMDAAADAATNGDRATIDVDAIDSRVERSLTRKVRKLIDDFPERSVDVVRAWLAEGRA